MEEKLIIGNWHFQRRIGRGGFGFVSLWENIKSGQKIAMKTCQVNPNMNESSSEKFKERWNREIQYMTHEVKNENIVQGLLVNPKSFLMELSKTSTMPILVMEYCEGGDLRTALNKQKNTNGLMESEVRNVLKCLSSAINYLHEIKICHRDIKPENCVIKTNLQGEKIYKLTDLGYAKEIDRNSLNASLVGTAVYVAPELIIGEKYSNTVDYFSFGIIAFEVITGVRPFVPHLPMACRIELLREKKSEHICVTETNKGITYGTFIFPENQVSSCFKTHMENWLRLASEWNPKHRGHVFETQKSKSVSFADMSNTLPPISILRIFTMLDEILSKKILTVFCLYNYQSYSFDINTSTTMNDFLDAIENTTTIPKGKIRLTIPVDNHQLEKIDENTKPIDLYFDKYFDKPMLFVGYSGTLMKADTIIEIPELVKLVMADFKIKLKPHILKRFVYNVFYFIQNEQKKYVTALDGFYNHSLQLNHHIELYETEISKMLKLTYGLKGAVKFLDQMLSALKAKDDESFQLSEVNMKLREQCKQLNIYIGVLVHSSDKIVNCYRSVLRRSWELINHPMLVQEAHKKDYFNITELSAKFKMANEHFGGHISNNNRLLDIFKRAYKDCLNKRDELLRADQFIKLQKRIFSVSIDSKEIEKSVKNAVLEGEMYERELHQISDDGAFLNFGEPVKFSYEITDISDSVNSDSGNSILEINEILRKRILTSFQTAVLEINSTVHYVNIS